MYFFFKPCGVEYNNSNGYTNSCLEARRYTDVTRARSEGPPPAGVHKTENL